MERKIVHFMSIFAANRLQELAKLRPLRHLHYATLQKEQFSLWDLHTRHHRHHLRHQACAHRCFIVPVPRRHHLNHRPTKCQSENAPTRHQVFLAASL